MNNVKNYLLFDEYEEENEHYLYEQLITYIGNKRSLLPFIGQGLDIISRKLNKRKLILFDIFSGSGVVSRYFKRYAEKLITNDLEKYTEIINSCYLANYSDIDLDQLKKHYCELINKLEKYPLVEGIITKLYAPIDDDKILKGERVFYTNRNARYIDTARGYIENIPEDIRQFYIAPLLSEASIHANTSGVFKGFYKDSKKGIGKFGGNNSDALQRIKGDIELPFPIFSNFYCNVEIHKGDANDVVESLAEVDVAYIDPPYNQHPYGSNYFMLNLICDYEEPERISSISGIPNDWKRSLYNKKTKAFHVFEDLIKKLNAKFLIISFNSEGFISTNEMVSMLDSIGKVEVLEINYNTFRGSRNLKSRNIYVKEYLYLLEKN